MTSPDELRAKARGAALALLEERTRVEGSWDGVYDSHARAIAEAVLSAILPELDARVRAAREEERDRAVAWLRAMAAALADYMKNGAMPRTANNVVKLASIEEMAGWLARGEHRETEGG